MSELVGAVLTRPPVDAKRAAAILLGEWSVHGTLRALPSERDRNFAVVVDRTETFVLKISNATDERSLIDFQHDALRRLVAAGVRCPVPVPTLTGETLATTTVQGVPLLARLLRWVPGRPLASVLPVERPASLLRDLGRLMGRTATALRGWDHPAAHRPFQWNALDGLAVIDAHARAVVDPVRAGILASWRRRLAPLADTLPRLRSGVIHNDANDHNVLVTDDGTAISGLLDMGDAVWSAVADELAVTAAYAALKTADPLAIIGLVREGFEQELPLTAEERRSIVDLVGLRLATSVALSAHQSRLDPEDSYLTISERPAWDLLERLAAIDRDEAASIVGDRE